MTRIIARLGVATLMLALVGCLISGPEPAPEFYSMVRIAPDRHLEAAPDSTIYELWTFNVDIFETTFVETTFDEFSGAIVSIQEFESFFPRIGDFTPIVRFQWDPDNYRALDENGDVSELYSPDGRGKDIGKDILLFNSLAVTIEPRNDPNPNAIDGPIVMAYAEPSGPFGNPVQALRENKVARLDPGAGLQQGGGAASFSVLAQSIRYQQALNGETACWREPGQGRGIWFARTQVQDLIAEDTAGFNVFEPGREYDTTITVINPDSSDTQIIRYRGTLFTKDIDRNLDGKPYLLWIFPDQPELSWSNFDLADPLFANTTPNLIFRDGVPQHQSPDRPPPLSGENAQSSNPMVRDGDTIGYMYFNPLDLTDTCFLRIDFPDSTYCQSEPESIKFQPFIDTNLVIRQFTQTWGDTLILPSLANLPVSQGQQAGQEFSTFFEAWVIFDSAENPVHPPLSLGLFGSPGGQFQNDLSPLYHNPAMSDPNFHYPGEDFINMSSRPDLPDSMDLFALPDVSRLKIWITIEPFPVDWAPEKPYTQLLTYVGEIFPDNPAALSNAEQICDDPTSSQTAPATLNYPLFYRPISINRTDLAEGHNWPSMMIYLSNPFEEE